MPETNNNDVTSALVQDLLKEKRADRRWRNIRFIAWFALIAYIVFGGVKYMGDGSMQTDTTQSPYAALVRIEGMIAPGRDLSAEELLPVLHKAFADKKAVGVVIDINSPGGTPVQAAIIHDAILMYKKQFNKKVIIVGEDLLTSGAYYVAVAGDRIYVNPNTITGSIGVIMKGFGFVDAMKKIGIERRVYIAGDVKDRLDPFLPQTADDEAKIKTVINEVHQNFINAVNEGRKGKLNADPAQLFSGDFWIGQTAVKMGLVDGLGNLTDVTVKEFNTRHLKEFGGSTNFFKMISGQIGSAVDNLTFTY